MKPGLFDDVPHGNGIRYLVEVGIDCVLDAKPLDLLDDVGTLLVQPDKYHFLRCQDLVVRSNALSAREKELTSLSERAKQGVGGSVISAAVYGTELEQVRTELRMVYQTSREKNCEGAQGNPTSGAVLR